MRRTVSVALLVAAASAAVGPARADDRRFALLAGAPDGGPGTQRLRYAERDARRMHDILTRVGGVRPEDARLLLSPGPRELRAALAELGARAAAAGARGEHTVLLVYFSGHARDGALRLGAGALPLDELREALERAPADVRIGLVDSCRSGAIARAKGIRPVPAFEVKGAAEAGPRGLVLIASSAADEDSQESDAIGASFFTHHLASGLLGGADASGDGRVTLAEAYAYAYARTVGSTAASAAGVQHPVFLYDLGGAGDVVLTELPPTAGGGLVFPAAAEGVYVVLDGAGRAVAEVGKPAGAERRLSLPAGRYTVKKRLPSDDALLVGEVRLGAAPVPVDDARLDRVPAERDPQKGYAGARWSILATAGVQTFFDRAARDGLFPPAALGGVEVAVRDDLGHGLAWGLDAALGGGKGTVRLPGVDLAARFAELSGGASLWRDWTIGRLTVSAGGRVGFVWMERAFPPAEQLPQQWFFTVTPGLVGAAAWRFSPALSAIARLRVSYLFYNVDGNRSLGYVEGLAGVEYAFGE